MLRAVESIAHGLVAQGLGIEWDESGGESAFAEEAAEKVGDGEGETECGPDFAGAEAVGSHGFANQSQDAWLRNVSIATTLALATKLPKRQGER